MDDRAPTTAGTLVCDWLRAGPHKVLLSVGQTSADLLRSIATGADAATVHIACAPPAAPHDWLQALAVHARFDAAVLSGVVETLPEAATTSVLASLRDVLAGRFLLLFADDVWSSSGATAKQLLALGLRGIGPVDNDGCTLQAWEYDLANYKRTPDWLNARGWAHPENWGRYRW